MSKFLIYILTKTMIPRAIAMAIAGALVVWGLISDKPTVERTMTNAAGEKVIVQESPKNIVGEALTVLIVGAASLLIEKKKDSETMKTQQILHEVTPQDMEVKVDGLAGPETRRAVKVANTE